MQEVHLAPMDPQRLEPVIGIERFESFAHELAPRMAEAFDGVAIVNVNSTPAGGGVAEMLHVLLPVTRGLGIDARWLAIEGEPVFFAVTKRLHNFIHGAAGDGGVLDEAAHEAYVAVTHSNDAELKGFVKPGDPIILHDPQTAGLAEGCRRRGHPVVWRCHIGADAANERTEAAWAFLRRYLEGNVDAYVFTRREYAPDWVPADRLFVIPPSIDPLSPKNAELSSSDACRILQKIGVLDGDPQGDVALTRPDGSPMRVRHYADVVRTGPATPPQSPLVVQVSRWDHLKDMVGVMQGFADHVFDGHGAHLALVGPVVTAVADDPEGAEVLQECWNHWRGLPHAARARIQLVCLPMGDGVENAWLVNALQRHAAVVVQKSLAEGFGLTVTEAMFKGRPVVASAVGGIVDQIVDGESGLLVRDPTDLASFGAAVRSILDDRDLGQRLGEGARVRAGELFLTDTHLAAWAEVVSSLRG
ncbi:MAG: glycosyltransferase [Acidimicrobiales bacterium]